MDTIVIQNKLFRFQTEYDNTDDITRRGQIKAIIDKLKKNKLNNVEKFNQILNNIQTVQSKKPYYRLNSFQKEQIVKNYVIKNWGELKTDEYTKEIMTMIGLKQITTPNIVYDIESGELQKIKNHLTS